MRVRQVFMSAPLFLGIDLGSITVKVVLTTADGQVLFEKYQRHGAASRQTLAAILTELAQAFPDETIHGTITGSGALNLAKALGFSFVQEVIASSRIIGKLAPQTDVAIELGGEDAKILYFGRSIDLRMNEACAGGTGAFIDQMAALLHTDTLGLNTLASKARTIHPIASRCGVFAKTDLVSLLNEGISREDLAVSVLQAVVEQTISGLACGHPIRGNVAFLGGPLHFLPELVKRFAATLSLTPEQTIQFPDSQFMVARGAALCACLDKPAPVSIAELLERVKSSSASAEITQSLPPLFADQADYAEFRTRHAKDAIRQKKLEDAEGSLFLGVDLGSTTVKSVLIDEDGAVLDQSYNRNDGDPLKALTPYLITLLDRIPPKASLRAIGTTGYGANLAKAALSAQYMEVETVAHLKAACFVRPDTTYVIDIGGQDMKCLEVMDGAVSDVRLNEACSSGCGAFLQTFATGLGMSMSSFVQAALFAKHPVDLGSRCTVFMNSKVKQAQKEGACVADIAAGLCYSVIRNALYKVLRLKSPEELGEHVLVQGGSFLNDALLRIMENMLHREVTRPSLAGHMGAYGIALMCLQKKDALPPCTLTSQALRELTIQTKAVLCKGCGNHCHLTINKFSNGQRLISGNRCEKGGGTKHNAADDMPSIYAWKEKRLFSYTPLAANQAKRGSIGIPRVLNMYERYPFWFTLFTELGFRVELSPASNKEIYNLGISSMPSQTFCFPAKLAHGHVNWLIARKIPHIFYPCIPREKKETLKAFDSYSCPVVCGYPEVVRLNTEELEQGTSILHTPYVNPEDASSLSKTIAQEFSIPRHEVKKAIKKAFQAQDDYRCELRDEALRILKELKRTGGTGIVLCGRPYHVDPLVHHGIPNLITSLGAAVLSEDSIAFLYDEKKDSIPLRVVDQWSFPARLYRAAKVVAGCEDLELVQLTSFGCGIDAVTSDQVNEILRHAGKMHTLIKIDEGQSLGAARIRIRSLLASLGEQKERRKKSSEKTDLDYLIHPPVFAKSMKDTCDIIAPQMSPIHFNILEAVFKGEGYRFHVLPTVSASDIETGLKYVNNDACYPAQVVIGQLIGALKSGDVDPDHTAMLLSQTCGPCRATNYPGLLKRALKEAGFANIPALTFRSNGATTLQPGFVITNKFFNSLYIALLYGDMLQRLSQHTLTYEINKGDTEELVKKWTDTVSQSFAAGKSRDLDSDMQQMTKDFASIAMRREVRPKVGIVGEILLAYHPDANRHIADLTRQEGGEPVLADIVDFFLYCFSDPIYQWQKLGGKALPAFLGWYMIQKFDRGRNILRRALADSPFQQIVRFKDLFAYAGKLISPGYQAGEGWLLSAELLKFMSQGTSNALCLQPFGCLPNHVVGRGVFKAIKKMCADANLMAMDYEGGTSDANLLNRIKLFMSMAHAPAL